MSASVSLPATILTTVNHECTMHTPHYTLRWLLYSFLCVAADILDSIISMFYSAKKPEVSLKPSDVDSLSDKQIKKMMFDIPYLLDEHSSIFRLSVGTIAKLSEAWPGEDRDGDGDGDGHKDEDEDEDDLLDSDDDDNSLRYDDDDDLLDEGPVDCSEANALNILFEKTNIPVPRVRRVINWRGNYILVMDHIQGPTLAEVWPTYSLWMKIRVAFTLRRYVRELFRVKASVETPPGPLSNEEPKICYLPSIFGNIRSTRGPFGSYKELTAFFNSRYWLGRKVDDHPLMNESFDDSSPLVITHNALDRRHIIVGEDGHLWVVGWASAGYYPPWFEYVSMDSIICTDRFWELVAPFVCGPYLKQLKWIDRAVYCRYNEKTDRVFIRHRYRVSAVNAIHLAILPHLGRSRKHLLVADTPAPAGASGKSNTSGRGGQRTPPMYFQVSTVDVGLSPTMTTGWEVWSGSKDNASTFHALAKRMYLTDHTRTVYVMSN
ncbi:hypothetical protein D9619_006363 [Psilocybe cf. subviscida]|uniref:Uncharacterized protein n=1 Tax=Psilocybe cf. subviscida TaxID=2480587 RepID=A0A8H5EXS0_9AGAR|nr:hypothetical protein D9619_006363 [Psilocybe cf. subviscida]